MLITRVRGRPGLRLFGGDINKHEIVTLLPEPQSVTLSTQSFPLDETMKPALVFFTLLFGVVIFTGCETNPPRKSHTRANSAPEPEVPIDPVTSTQWTKGAASTLGAPPSAPGVQ